MGKNLAAEQKIIYAPAGSTVQGTKVKAEEISGEKSVGVICTAVDMGWDGEANECVLLRDSCNAGEFAPASDKSKLLEGDEDDEEEEEEADNDNGEQEKRHSEYKIAEIMGARVFKKKKGHFIVEVDYGEDDTVQVVTNLPLAAGQKVIYAPEGSTVQGNKLEATTISGEKSVGAICTAVDLGWDGDANECILLRDTCKNGEFPPADKTSKLLEPDEEEEEEEPAPVATKAKEKEAPPKKPDPPKKQEPQKVEEKEEPPKKQEQPKIEEKTKEKETKSKKGKKQEDKESGSEDNDDDDD